MDFSLTHSLAFLAVPIVAAVLARLAVAFVGRLMTNRSVDYADLPIAPSMSWSISKVHSFHSLTDEPRQFDSDTK